jgi:hypothetical protein
VPLNDVKRKKMKPFFSILVPVYNHEKFVGLALDSLLAQTDPDWEACVVDDGSTDGTPAILDAYSGRDPRIRVFHKTNGGTASALNHAISNARGEWICWLSSDDLFLPEKLAIHRKAISRNPGCPYYFTDFMTLDDETGQQGPPYTSFMPDPRWMALDLLAVNYVNGISICVKRELFEHCGIFDGASGYGQDYELHLKMLAKVEGIRLPEVTCLSRSHSGQGGRTGNLRMMFDCALTAVRFLNYMPFRRMLPRVSLFDEDQAKQVLARAVEIAAGVHSYVYQAGGHPGLIMRVMEWVWGNELEPKASRRLKMEFGRRARAAAYACRHTALGVPWRMAAILSEVMPGKIEYDRVEPFDVVDTAYIDALAKDLHMASAIGSYAERFQGRTLERSLSAESPCHGLSVVVAGESREIAEKAVVLAKAGCSVLRLCEGKPGWAWSQGVYILYLPRTSRAFRALVSVAPVNVAVVEARPLFMDIACAAESRIVVNSAVGAWDISAGSPLGHALKLKRCCAVLAGRCARKLRAWFT